VVFSAGLPFTDLVAKQARARGADVPEHDIEPAVTVEVKGCKSTTVTGVVEAG
jgi:hypothetical protein